MSFSTPSCPKLYERYVVTIPILPTIPVFDIAGAISFSCRTDFPTTGSVCLVCNVEKGPPESVMRTFRSKKIDCGKPKRLLVKPGDAFIVHQRLGIAQGINLSDQVRKAVYFRVVHTDFDELLDDFLEAQVPFTGFEPIQDIVADVLDN